MYLVFDTETTGFPPKARMTQLAYLLMDEKGNELESYQSIVIPDGWEVPKKKFFIDNNMSTERCLAEGRPVFEVLRKFQEALKKCNYKIAHNIRFDNQIVLKEIKLANITWQLFHYKKGICTMMEAYNGGYSGTHANGNTKWPKLIELHEKLFNKEFDGAHDALADVRATAKCFIELKNRGIIKFT